LTDGKFLRTSQSASGGWGHWPQPPEALDFDESPIAGSGITRPSSPRGGASLLSPEKISRRSKASLLCQDAILALDHALLALQFPSCSINLAERCIGRPRIDKVEVRPLGQAGRGAEQQPGQHEAPRHA